MRLRTTILTLLSLLLATTFCGAEEPQLLGSRIGSTLKQDYANYYDLGTSGRMSAMLLTAAIIANTRADDDIQEWYQEDLRSDRTDDYARTAKDFGEKTILIPLTLGVAALGELLPEEGAAGAVGEWGRRSSRAYVVGAPTVYLFQYFTGASRPKDGDGSDWRPFEDNNGVSGHAFVGSVPFMTVAQMCDNWFAKGFWYLASTATAASRVNDNAHYFSQALLGWYIGLEATKAVSATEEQTGRVTILPMPVENGGGIMLTGRF